MNLRNVVAVAFAATVAFAMAGAATLLSPDADSAAPPAARSATGKPPAAARTTVSTAARSALDAPEVTNAMTASASWAIASPPGVSLWPMPPGGPADERSVTGEGTNPERPQHAVGHRRRMPRG
jgi:hypothetical protein